LGGGARGGFLRGAAGVGAPALGEGLFKGGREAWRQELSRAIGADDHVVFATQAEFAGDIDAGLIRKRHAGFENGFAATHKIGMLMAVESDAVAEAVGEEFVVWAVAAIDDDGACGIIDGAGEAPGARGIQRGVLRFTRKLEGARDFFAGLAVHAGARDVGGIPIHSASSINQNDITFL